MFRLLFRQLFCGFVHKLKRRKPKGRKDCILGVQLLTASRYPEKLEMCESKKQRWARTDRVDKPTLIYNHLEYEIKYSKSQNENCLFFYFD